MGGLTFPSLLVASRHQQTRQALLVSTFAIYHMILKDNYEKMHV